MALPEPSLPSLPAEAPAHHRAILEAVLATALDAIVAMDAQGRVTEFNPAAERTFGYSRAEAIGRTMGELIVPPRLRDAHWSALRRYLDTRVPHILGKRIELPALHANGTEFPIELAITVVPGEPPLFIGFMRDITERHRAEAERTRLLANEREARGEAESASRAKSEFLAAMSHELRTPLNAIGGYAELLALGVRGPVTPEQRDDLERLRRSQQHLLAMINDVLHFAKITAGHVRYDIQPVRVADVVADVETTVGPLVRDRGLRYVNRLGSSRSTVLADRERLTQILTNLFTNAVKYTFPGGLIEVECDESGDAVAIRVRDTGIGIPEERLSSIFDPFFQVHRRLNRPLEGLGLGLAVSRDIARGMQGDLTVSSVAGEGSAFVVTLRKAPSGTG